MAAASSKAHQKFAANSFGFAYLQYSRGRILIFICVKVLRVFLLAIHSHLYLQIVLHSPLEQKWFETGL